MDIYMEILNLLQEKSMLRFPAFPEAFGRLIPKPYKGMSAPLGMDGKYLYYEPEQLCSCFLSTPSALEYLYLHTHMHGLCQHVVRGFTQEKASRDQYCDEEAARLMSRLVPELSVEEALQLRDSHEFWPHASANAASEEARVTAGDKGGRLTATRLSSLEEICRRWESSAAKLQAELASENGGKARGSCSGSFASNAILEQKASIDYHQFLQHFMISREEAILDPDAFDYIPYCFGLARYGKMPLIEPLEYQEVNRLDELAIAIDTSGSCSGRIVRRFLEETWSILRHRENFFSKMRVHLIQCDCAVLEHRVITSPEEWEAMLPQLRILGHGDTDFRPVFDFIRELTDQKEIRQLRGLLYFTDGDGIYPRQAPAYETAFVFLNQELEKHKIPDWAIRLNLYLPDDF